MDSSDLKILSGVSQDKLLDVVRTAQAEYHVLRSELENQNVSHEHRDRLLASARDALTERIESKRREELQRVDSELQGLEQEYRKKMEGKDLFERGQRIKMELSPRTDDEINGIAHDFIMRKTDVIDRVEIAALTGELEARKSPLLGQFRDAVKSQNALAPWNKLSPALVERKAALERAQYGSLPIHVKSANGNQTYMEIPIGDFLK